MTPKVGIILINYKTYARRFLEDCRDSMRGLDYPKDKYTVYIVDNATTPETQAYLRQIWPEAVVIPNVENSGWGGGNNVGIERAFKDGCEDIVLSNMDVIVEKGWLKELVEAAYSDAPPPQPALALTPTLSQRERGIEAGRGGLSASPLPAGEGGRGPGEGKPIGIVQSKLLLWPIGPDGVQRTNSIGNQIHFLGFGYCRGYGDPDVNGQWSMVNGQVSDIPYASGASMYVKGEVFKKIGLCNPDFFMYHDDMDLCLKAKLAGYRVVLAPRSIMWHKFETARGTKQIYWMERNRILLLLLVYKIPTLLLILPPFFVMELGLLTKSLVSGWAGPKWRSWGYFFRPGNWRKIRAMRRNVQALRTVTDRELLRDVTGKILYQGRSTPIAHYQEVRSPLLRYVVNPVFNAYWQIARRLMFW